MSKRCCAQMCFNSQTINKDVCYFGFPKYEEFALKWAIAAGRPDLLEKKINCITKYYLCSEHFTKDCFMDPPANTRLKKKINPVCIPIPSIFKCNIDRYLPINAKSKPINEEEDDHRTLTNDGFLMNKAREGISLESLSVFHDHYNYLDMSSCAASFLNNIDDISLTMNDLSNENTFENIAECNPIDIESSNTCRLCANMFLTSETLVELSSKPELCKRINVFIPNMINLNDNLPQMACNDCLEKLDRCVDTLDSFKTAQKHLQKNYDYN